MKPVIYLFTVLMVMCSALAAQGGEFRVESSVAISEEYTDNIFLEGENEDEEYITRITPSVSLQYEAPLWRWDVGYTLDYVDYTKGKVDDETINDANVSGLINVVRDVFFVDVSNRFRRVSIDATRDFTEESLFINQSDRNVFNVNPYIVLRPHRLARVTTGYEYTNIWYEEDTGVDREDHSAYVDAALELSPEVESTAGYRYTREDTDRDGFREHEIHFGLSYEYRRNSELYFTLGNTWLDFDEGSSFSTIFWTAGASFAAASWSGSVETSRSYEEDPGGDVLKVDGYVLSLKKPFKKSSVELSLWLREYSDGETDVLETRAYGTAGGISHEFTPKTSGNLDFTIEKLERFTVGSYTRRILVGSRINYMLLKDLTLTFQYRYIDSHSPGIVVDNYENNRFILEARKSF